MSASAILSFLTEKGMKLKARKTSASEFWLETSDGFITVKFVADEGAHEILYDVFSPKYDVHLKVETLRDVEKLDFITEETRKWEYEKSIEDLWFTLDWIKVWAHKNKFDVKETHLL